MLRDVNLQKLKTFLGTLVFGNHLITFTRHKTFINEIVNILNIFIKLHELFFF